MLESCANNSGFGYLYRPLHRVSTRNCQPLILRELVMLAICNILILSYELKKTTSLKHILFLLIFFLFFLVFISHFTSGNFQKHFFYSKHENRCIKRSNTFTVTFIFCRIIIFRFSKELLV